MRLQGSSVTDVDELPGPRAHLDALIAALNHHLFAVESAAGESDPIVFAAYDRLRDAFGAYEDALYDRYDEVVPMTLVEEGDEEDDEEDEDDLDDELEDEPDEDDEPVVLPEDPVAATARAERVGAVLEHLDEDEWDEMSLQDPH